MRMITEGYTFNEFIKTIRHNLVQDPRTVYFGRILQSMRLVIINDMTPQEVDYDDPKPTAYRTPEFIRVFCPGGWKADPRVIKAWCTKPTMAVDMAGNLYVGEQFISKDLGAEFTDLPTYKEAVTAILIHESMHISELTFFRGKVKNPMVWNIATDAYINFHIIRNDKPLPKGGVIPDKNGNLDIPVKTVPGQPPKIFRLTVLKKSAEMLYEELMEIFGGEGKSQPPPPQKKVLEVGDVVFNKATKEYGVLIGTKPFEARIISKEEALKRATMPK